MEKFVHIFSLVVLGAIIIFGISALVWGEQYRAWSYRRRKIKRVYLCHNNGVTGVVLPREYDWEANRFWERVRAGKIQNPGWRGPLIDVWQLFLFSDQPLTPRTRCSGTMAQLEQLITGCEVERRVFYLPPLNGEIPGEGNFRHQVTDQLYNFADAWEAIHGYKLPEPAQIATPDGTALATKPVEVSRP